MRISRLLGLAALLSVGLTLRAATITYTESSTASGSLGGQAFTNALVTITSTGDTSSVTGSGGVFTITLPAELTVAGIGSTAFTDTISFVSNQNVPDAGVGDFTSDLAVMFTSNSVFSTYDLQSAIGPVTGEAVFNSGASFATLDGAFIINAATTSTFQAVTSTSTVTPEPSSIALLGTGLLGFAGLVRRRLV